MEVLLIIGGNSLERQFSNRSASDLQQALHEQGHEVGIFDLRRDLKQLTQSIKAFDVVFPIVHGIVGAGGKLQRILAESDKPYLGGDPTGFEKGWDKISFKRFCEQNDIATAPWQIVKRQQEVIDFGFPNVVKTGRSEFSKQVFILKSVEDLDNPDLRKIFTRRRDIFVERFINGNEVAAGILGNQSLPILEIVPPEIGFFDFKAKLNTLRQKSKVVAYAPSLSPNTREQVSSTALAIHHKLDLGCYSRLDFIVEDGHPFTLEANTVVGLYKGALFPAAAEFAGISYSQLVERLIEIAIDRFNQQKNPGNL